ncbi:MAG: hypothetical protein K6E35_06360 [Bacteroidales bacterium]|nr:hypothetical protein [Bacteroidales bacterium]
MDTLLPAAEQAYAFFHQKEKVYVHSQAEWEKDHIEEAIATYVNRMSPALYEMLSGGAEGYLREHVTFAADLRDAVTRLERMLR